MDTPTEQTPAQNECANGWSPEQKRQLASVCFPLIQMQKQYGRNMDEKIIMQGWEIKLSKRFTIEQIIFAVDKYTDRNDDFPTPSDIINILDPEPAEISRAEYIEAKKWLERNNYNEFSEQHEIVKNFEKQERRKRNPIPPSPDNNLLQIAAETVKKLK